VSGEIQKMRLTVTAFLHAKSNSLTLLSYNDHSPQLTSIPAVTISLR